MKADPIFNAVASTEIIWAEIYRLVATLPDAFSPDLVLRDWTEEGLEDDWAGQRTGFHFEAANAVKGQRLPSQKEVVNPIKGLLFSDLPVESVFDQTSAIRFTREGTSEN